MKLYQVIGIIGAMDEEIETLKHLLKNDSRDFTCMRVAGMDFFIATLENINTKILSKIILVCSGIGKVNAGICAQILIDRFGVDLIINSGIAGAISTKLEVGDIVISKDAVQHDVDARAFGYLKGQIPKMDTLAFPIKEELTKLAYEICKRVNPEINVYIGRIVSGDQFIADSKVKQRIAEEFEGYCTEMEGAGIAQVAYLNQVDCLIIRAISDKADGVAHITFKEMKEQAIKHCVKLIWEYIKNLR